MMNHKLTLRLYGVRRPLKWRRRMARFDNRLAANFMAHDKAWRGRHERWMAEGVADLHWQEYKAREGITDEQEEQMREEMPF